jgi:hypothetical protein
MLVNLQNARDKVATLYKWNHQSLFFLGSEAVVVQPHSQSSVGDKLVGVMMKCLQFWSFADC